MNANEEADLTVACFPVVSVVVNQALSMYGLCVSKIKYTNVKLQEEGRLYYCFESAVGLYKKEGVVLGESNAASEFNDLMDFVYLGRRAR